MAALAVAASLEPPTANEELAVNPLLVACTVMMRLVGSAPIETTAVAWPEALVTVPEAVKLALLSTENDTGMPAMAWPDDVVAVAVAVTFWEPSF